MNAENSKRTPFEEKPRRNHKEHETLEENLLCNSTSHETSVLLINDMAGYGKVALSVMIPLLSSMRINVYNLPTALVSNTLDYGKFDILETTDYMRNTLDIWKELGFSFDAVATGFIVSEEQSLLISDYCSHCKSKGIPVFVDPIMGDEGVLYNGVTEANVDHMRRLCQVADVIMPNITEAKYLTGMNLEKDVLTKGELLSIANALHDLGPRSVIITSALIENEDSDKNTSDRKHKHVTLVSEASSNFENAGMLKTQEAHQALLPYEEIPVRLPGTGDIFSSVIIGRYLNGRPLVESVKTAMDTVVDMLNLCKDNDDKYKGVPIELYLDRI